MSSHARQSLALVVGQNCKDIRSAAGVTQDELARHAREAGLRWDAAKVGRFESGAVAPTFATVLAVSLALSKALADAGAGRGAILADLVATEGNVTLTTDAPGPLGTVLADVCRGRPWPTEPADLYGTDELAVWYAHTRIVDLVTSRALVDGYLDPNLTSAELAQMRQRSGLTEDRLAQRLNISRDRLAAVSFRLWDGRTFGQERDRRAGSDANQQKKGRIARALRAELERALADGND